MRSDGGGPPAGPSDTPAGPSDTPAGEGDTPADGGGGRAGGDGMPAEPVERKKVYELVAERLMRDIAERRLRPGDQVPPERTLVRAYSVGRSSVREALRMLESRGLIVSHGAGAFSVAGSANPLRQSLSLLMDLRDVGLSELFEVRRMLEVEAAGLAAARARDEDYLPMERAIREMTEGIASQELYTDADVRFHMSVAKATHNEITSHLMEAIRAVMRRALRSIFHVPGSPERSNEDHRSILRAIVNGEPDAAREAMRRHLLRVQEESEQALAQAIRSDVAGGR
jgi:GntR family transcriptional regulator, transcriptional repressor for pyruvate dehydrogenase complex